MKARWLGAALVAALIAVGYLFCSSGSAELPPLTVHAEPAPEYGFLSAGGSPQAPGREALGGSVGEAPAGLKESLAAPRIFSGTVIDPAGNPQGGLVVAIRPLWGVNYTGPPEALRAALGRAETTADGRFSFEVSRELYAEDYLFCAVAKADRTRSYVQGEFLLRADHVVTIPAEDSWALAGSIRALADPHSPLGVMVFKVWDDAVSSLDSRLMPVAMAKTEGGTGAVDLTGIVEPIRAETDPLTMFVSWPGGMPLARLAFRDSRHLGEAVGAGIEIASREVVLDLVSPPGWPPAESVRVRFGDSSTFLPTPEWRSPEQLRYLKLSVGSGEFLVHGRAASGEQMFGLFSDFEAFRWVTKTPFEHLLEVRVRDAESRPIEGVDVSCRPETGDPVLLPQAELETRSQRTDAGGIARFNLPPGSFVVRAPRGAGKRNLCTRQRTVVVPGDAVELQLGAAPALVWIRGSRPRQIGCPRYVCTGRSAARRRGRTASLAIRRVRPSWRASLPGTTASWRSPAATSATCSPSSERWKRRRGCCSRWCAVGGSKVSFGTARDRSRLAST